jgi:acetoin utilization deacetylase AcuC-like enzyme
LIDTPAARHKDAPTMAGVAIVYHPDYVLHDTGPHHPEQADRAARIAGALRAAPFADALTWMRPEPAEPRWIETVHSAEYRAFIEESCLSGRRTVDFGETLICEESYRVATLAAGGALRAVDAVLRDGYARAFSCARPPGHHARYEQAMGFCLFNNIAIATAYAEITYQTDRVCIIDWDVHHGNGTQETFYRSPRVLFCSLHQLPLYPHTGESYDCGSDDGHGLTVNVPLAPGSAIEAYEEALHSDLAPAIEAFRPRLFLISAGFDAHAEDAIADLRLRSADYATLTRMVRTWADRYAEGRIVSILEGGYHPQALVASALAHVEAML